MSGATNSPSIVFNSSGGGQDPTLVVSQNITIPSFIAVTTNISPSTGTFAELNLTGGGGNSAINIGTDLSVIKVLIGSVSSTNTLSLSANLIAGQVLLGAGAGSAPTFTTNNFSVTTGAFNMNQGAITVNLGSSTIHLTLKAQFTAANSGSFIVSNTDTPTLDAGTSTVSIESSDPGVTTSMLIAQNTTFYNVNIASGVAASFSINTASTTFTGNILTFIGSGGSAAFGASNYANDKYVWAGLVANALSSNPDVINSSSPGTRAIVTVTPGANVQNTNFTDINASNGGAINTAGGTVSNSVNINATSAPSAGVPRGGLLGALI